MTTDDPPHRKTVVAPTGWRMTMLRWRVKVARAVLLPELAADEAAQLRQRVVESSKANRGYALMCALSAGIATLGLLQGSAAVVIGAMLISPLMAPIAALGFGFASIDGQRIRDAARVVAIGAAIGILMGVMLTLISPIRNATPEIIARTEPTLLDLAIALLSGIAGGYATVLGKGETTIGVAIATALMPPLATVGYGIGVLQPMFALGALLLFLTNLAAIAFAFAVIARLSGAARPIRNVTWSLRYTAAGLLTLLLLATPLALTLFQVTREASMRIAARDAIVEVTGASRLGIAQLDVKWPLSGQPTVSAVVVTPRYATNAGAEIASRLARIHGVDPDVVVQQVLAADVSGQTKALVDAAMERTVAGIAADVPPLTRLRASIGLPTRGIWLNRTERTVIIEPVAAPGWTLAHYRAAEQAANADIEGWTVNLFPPVQDSLRVGSGDEAVPPDLAAWALQRWGMAQVAVAFRGEALDPALLAALDRAGIAAKMTSLDSEEGGDDTDGVGDAVIEVLAAPPPLPGAEDGEG
ncbi:DUF389 domain-containing protein [Croceicoccus sp. BE223]|uniref:DUF389 domain-containing protein n=1 Tax=Croceicoccus sp. BE223 TaxID=2817716 RepID=UPI00286528CD|nr:DUF389 domain-containing protein [Croceicoccus sp. BE223]MDR7103808.1 putative hydrophobic protein (TIGR00271 family) [Croceicoccus sp. BE223]